MEKRGKSTEGLKAELVNRLQAILDEEEFNLADDAAGPTPIISTITENNVAEPSLPAPEPVIEENVKLVTAAEEGTPTVALDLPTTNDKAESTRASQAGTELSFEEKKRLRAQRFAIPFVETKTSSATSTAEQTKKRQKTDSTGEKTILGKEEVLLPKDEIEKQLKRAEKYGGANQARVDELKAMLRKYRFASNN